MLEIRTAHGVVAARLDGVADEGMSIVLPLEIAAVDTVMVAREEHPVAFGFERRGVVVDNRRVPDDAMVGLELDHRSAGGCAAVKQEAVDGHVGRVDFEK